MILNEEVCPWNIDFDGTDVYFYDKLVSNPWNPHGNGWRADNGMMTVECYDPDKYPQFSCGCSVVNVTSDGGRISEYHPQKLGKYLGGRGSEAIFICSGHGSPKWPKYEKNCLV